MNIDFKGKRVLITGATKGIGAAIAIIDTSAGGTQPALNISIQGTSVSKEGFIVGETGVTARTAHLVQINRSTVAATGHGLNVVYDGLGDAINIALGTGLTNQAIVVTEDNVARTTHMIEVTPDKKVVWTFFDHKTMKTIASVQLLDVPGDATRGEIMH